jgi:hypothetical protein
MVKEKNLLMDDDVLERATLIINKAKSADKTKDDAYIILKDWCNIMLTLNNPLPIKNKFSKQDYLIEIEKICNRLQSETRQEERQKIINQFLHLFGNYKSPLIPIKNVNVKTGGVNIMNLSTMKIAIIVVLIIIVLCIICFVVFTVKKKQNQISNFAKKYTRTV